MQHHHDICSTLLQEACGRMTNSRNGAVHRWPGSDGGDEHATDVVHRSTAASKTPPAMMAAKREQRHRGCIPTTLLGEREGPLSPSGRPTAENTSSLAEQRALFFAVQGAGRGRSNGSSVASGTLLEREEKECRKHF